MAYDPDNQVLRLPKKHASGIGELPDPDVGRRLENAQSIRNAAMAGAIVVILFTIFWLVVSTLTQRVFPWFPVLLGFALGYIVRAAGKGLDWRFPALAAALALVGSMLGLVVISASYTARELEASTVTILTHASQLTWPVFFDEVVTAADYIFALIAAGIAAFYSNRRLSRRQYYALRQWHESQADD